MKMSGRSEARQASIARFFSSSGPRKSEVRTVRVQATPGSEASEADTPGKPGAPGAKTKDSGAERNSNVSLALKEEQAATGEKGVAAGSGSSSGKASVRNFFAKGKEKPKREGPGAQVAEGDRTGGASDGAPTIAEKKRDLLTGNDAAEQDAGVSGSEFMSTVLAKRRRRRAVIDDEDEDKEDDKAGQAAPSAPESREAPVLQVREAPESTVDESGKKGEDLPKPEGNAKRLSAGPLVGSKRKAEPAGRGKKGKASTGTGKAGMKEVPEEEKPQEDGAEDPSSGDEAPGGQSEDDEEVLVVEAEEDEEDEGEGEEEEGGEGKEKEKGEKKAPRKAVTKKGPANKVTEKKYDVRGGATWEEGKPIPFLFLSDLFDRIEGESGRLSITAMLCNILRTAMLMTPADVLPMVYLAAGRVAPPHEGVELGIGDATIIKALAEATGRKEQQIKAEYKETGDLGLVAKASRTTQRMMRAPEPLSCRQVFEAFKSIAQESINDKKRARIKQLLVSARKNEPLFIVRLLQGKLRIGLAEQTLLAALAQAAAHHWHDTVEARKKSGAQGGTEGALENEEGEKGSGSKNALAGLTRARLTAEKLEEAMAIMKQAYHVLPVYDRILAVLLDPNLGIWALPQHCHFTPGVPVGPMLAKPTKAISDILDKFQGKTFTCEYKYDGERAQIHCLEDGTVEIYSRNAERNTSKYPDLVQAVLRRRKEGVKTFVLDAEAVAYDREAKKILPFQVLSTRARKGVAEEDIRVRVCLFAFDLLFLNGKDLLGEQLKARRELLYASFEEEPGEFQFATATCSNDTEELQAFVNDAVAHGCEGAMVKTLDEDATYEPAKRSNNWLKLKKDYMEGLGDSLDLVPIGAFHGRGKRAGVYGAFLLACYDPDREEYQSICKIGTGFSEAVLEERSNALRQKEIPAPPSYYQYPSTMNVDTWFSPAEVWEVLAADLSISPVHMAASGQVDDTKGIALRFPRFLRLRDDKSVEQATSAQQVAEMYRNQSVHNQQQK